jgi:hypothetical protein
VKSIKETTQEQVKALSEAVQSHATQEQVKAEKLGAANARQHAAYSAET